MSEPTQSPAVRLALDAKAFGRTQVLGRIDLVIARREVVAITGPSGIGKTTLLRILAGLDRQFEGRVERTERLAMVFQEPTLLPWRSALDNITVPTGVSAQIARHGLEEVGLGGRESHYPGELSLGQQRRLALARALAIDPDLLFMDEPFASLDPELNEEMLALTAGVLAGRETAVALVTHSLHEARYLASRIIRLDGQPAGIVSDQPNQGHTRAGTG